jgi:LuxR family maltose regulon positive regulatory protein
VGTVLALANGDAGLAARFAASIEDPFWAAISAARIAIFEGERADAGAQLESAVPRCPRHEVVLGLLTARAHQHPDDAVKAAAIAVERAAAAGMVQTVASEGPEVVELVERAAWQAPPAWLDRVRLAATAAPAHVDRLGLIEPLTERERDVLRFLPSRLTIREIADELFVSINTLKFHLKVIYRKLGVSSRAEAAEMARRLSHLPSSAP